MNYEYAKFKVFNITKTLNLFFFFCIMLLVTASFGQGSQTFTSSGTFSVPIGVSSITVQAWGAGGGGDNSYNNGGGGGAFALRTFAVNAGDSYSVTIGAGGAAGTGDSGEDSRFGTLVIAKGGSGGSTGLGGQASACTGTTKYSGGNGGSSSGKAGAGGGAAAGTNNDGATGGNTSNNTPASGGNGTNGGGNGGDGGSNSNNGNDGATPGGGGGERGKNGTSSGAGGDGKIIVSWPCPTRPSTPSAISGPSAPCAGATGIVYSVNTLANAATYEWTLPSGWVITAGLNTNSITVNIGSSGNITVKGVSSCGDKSYSPSQNNIGVVAIPSVPGYSTPYNFTCNGFTAQWGPHYLATAYYLDVATSNTFSPATILAAYDNLNVGNVQAIVLSGLSSGTTYYYRVRSSSSCGTSLSSATMSGTTTGPIVGTTSPDQSICLGSAPSNITITGNNGTIQWQVSSNNSSFSTITGATSATLSSSQMGALTATRYYRARIIANGCTSYSSVVTVTLTSPALTANGVTICAGGTGALTAVGSCDSVFTNTGTAISGTWNAATDPTAYRILSYTSNSSSCFFYSISRNYVATNFKVTTTGTYTFEMDSNYSYDGMAYITTGSFTPGNCSGGGTWVIGDDDGGSGDEPRLTTTLTAGVTYTLISTTYSSSNGTVSGAFSWTLSPPSGGQVLIENPSSIDWYTASTGGSPIATGASFNPVGVTGSGLANSNTAGTTTFYAACSSNSGCRIAANYVIRPAFTAGAISTTGQTFCATGNPGLIGSATAASGGDNTITYKWQANGVDIPSSNSATYSPAAGLTTTTTYTRFAKDNSCNTTFVASAGSWLVTVNAISTPSVETITPEKCNALGSIVLNNLPASGTINQSGKATASYPITGTLMTITNLAAGNYVFTVSNGSCTSAATNSIEIAPSNTNSWNGSVWSKGTPTINDKIVFAGNYPPAIDPNVDISGCSCLVSGGANVIIKSGKNLTISNEVKVVGSGSLTFEDTASLVQINNAAVNSGNIKYNRLTSSVLKSDYTYWSSPVFNQSLNISSSYASGLFYSYDDFATPENWKKESSATIMQVGKGYIIRGSLTGAQTVPGLYNATFVGVPNNGIKTLAIGPIGTSNLIGNPYPSALDADLFLATNASVIEGTIYIWTHKTAIQSALNIAAGKAGSGSLAYTSDDYATYNGVGGVAISGGIKPTGKIAAGQAFFTTSTATASSVTFNNTMRVAGTTLANGTGVNQQFFKTRNSKTDKVIEKNRIWLNLSNSEGAFKQTLVGYLTDATNDYDNRFDGQSFDGNAFIDFYSINNDKNLTIQGRALPFDENDEVPLGFTTTINGMFTINIDQADGVLTNQAVFLEDKLTNATFDLKSGNYTFSTLPGTFNDRFVLRYKDDGAAETLATTNFENEINKVLVSSKNKQIIVNSFSETIEKVIIYDLLGKQLYAKEKINNNELSIEDLVSSHQALIVKTTLQNGSNQTDKIIY